MTTTIIDTKTPPSATGSYLPARFADTLRSEWTKARTIPTTMWTLLAAVVLGVGLGALISVLAAHQYATGARGTRAGWDPTSISGAGLSIAQLALGVLGVLLVTSEYSTGAIRTGFIAVPRRGRFLAAKAVVVIGMTFVVSEVTAFVAFFIGQALISGHAPNASLGQPHVLRALIGCGLYGALIGLLGLALGALLRSAAASITILVAFLYVLPGIAAALPASIEHTVEKYWPTQAGQQITEVISSAHTLTPWAGLAVMCLFIALLATAAFLTVDRRDA